MKYDLSDIQVEISSISALLKWLGNQCEERGNKLTDEKLALAI